MVKYKDNEIAAHYLMLKSIVDEAEANGDAERADELEMRLALFAQRFEKEIFVQNEEDLELTNIFKDM